MKCFLEHDCFGFNVACLKEWSIQIFEDQPITLGRSDETHIEDMRVAVMQGNFELTDLFHILC